MSKTSYVILIAVSLTILFIVGNQSKAYDKCQEKFTHATCEHLLR